MTKQGIRDLNHYGPKPAKAQAPAPPAAVDLGETSDPQLIDTKNTDLGSLIHA